MHTQDTIPRISVSTTSFIYIPAIYVVVFISLPLSSVKLCHHGLFMLCKGKTFTLLKEEIPLVDSAPVCLLVAKYLNPVDLHKVHKELWEQWRRSCCCYLHIRVVNQQVFPRPKGDYPQNTMSFLSVFIKGKPHMAPCCFGLVATKQCRTRSLLLCEWISFNRGQTRTCIIS